jgi:putative MATE family efflux protein
VPEFISTLILISLTNVLDARWISVLKSNSTYASLNVTNDFIHFMLKLAEGFSIASVVMCGQYNGLGRHQAAGKAFRDVFWVNVVVGATLAGFLFFGASSIYTMYGLPEKMITIGTPYLRLQAVRVFIMFLYMSLISFLRSIKNTLVPMAIFIVGGSFFIFFDYALIFGKYGFPQMHLQGSALASIIQYSVMCILAMAYVSFHSGTKKYEISIFSGLSDPKRIKQIFLLSWPAIFDKASFAGAYIWLGSMITSMGTHAIASYGTIKIIERLALLPAIAFAQVVTFLVSNAYSRQDWQGIKSSVKKIFLLSAIFVSLNLLIFSWYASSIIPFFDPKGNVTAFSAGFFPYLSILAFFDVSQLILSGALRGAANVKTVMFVRIAVFVCYFFPVSYVFSRMSFESNTTKFFLIYGSFYVGNAIMSAVYIQRFRGEKWKGSILP